MSTDKPSNDHWIKPLAEQLVTSLRGNGGNANTYEANVEWTAAMISSRVPDCSPAAELAEAAKDANEVIYLVAAYLADDNRRAYAMKLRDAADTLSAALAKVEVM